MMMIERLASLGRYARALGEWELIATGSVRDLAELAELGRGLEVLVAASVEEVSSADPTLSRYEATVQAEVLQVCPLLISGFLSPGTRSLMEAEHWSDRPTEASVRALGERLRLEDLAVWEPTGFLPAELEVICQVLGVADPYRLR